MGGGGRGVVGGSGSSQQLDTLSSCVREGARLVALACCHFAMMKGESALE